VQQCHKKHASLYHSLHSDGSLLQTSILYTPGRARILVQRQRVTVGLCTDYALNGRFLL
jgi:hypothetical protein